tara:strand:+ start:320 stop:601 length:282 start_codon:yes stop_codon:yes gene_type:complete
MAKKKVKKGSKKRVTRSKSKSVSSRTSTKTKQHRTFDKVAGVVFAVVSVMHLLRATGVLDAKIMLGSYSIGLGLSWFIVILAGWLSWLSFKTS